MRDTGINTDFINDTGNPFLNFRAVADAGFSHIHWGHQWNTDFIYADAEIAEIKKQLYNHNLRLSDTHASSGVEKCWFSPLEYERLAGVELLKNRIYMTAVLGGDAVVLHPFVLYEADNLQRCRDQGLKSLSEVEAFSRSCGVRVALENLFQADGSGIRDEGLENLDTLDFYFSRFSPDFLGFCWDIGHCLILGDEAFRRSALFAGERLAVMHLNDNRGDFDQHSSPFTWSNRWEWIAEVIAGSPYPVEKPVLVEVIEGRNPSPSTAEFLEKNHSAALRFAEMLEKYKDKNQGL